MTVSTKFSVGQSIWFFDKDSHKCLNRTINSCRIDIRDEKNTIGQLDILYFVYRDGDNNSDVIPVQEKNAFPDRESFLNSL